jgi:hypothetical protein
MFVVNRMYLLEVYSRLILPQFPFPPHWPSARAVNLTPSLHAESGFFPND